MRLASASLVLPENGRASRNGTITINLAPLDVLVSIPTAAGEIAPELAKRIAATINSNAKLSEFNITAKADGNAVLIPNLSQAYACSDDAGLGIPAPPQTLSCTVSTEQHSVTMSWNNPEMYDRIAIVNKTKIGVRFVSGHATHYTIDYLDPSFSSRVNDLTLGVVAQKGEIGCLVVCKVRLD